MLLVSQIDELQKTPPSRFLSPLDLAFQKTLEGVFTAIQVLEEYGDIAINDPDDSELEERILFDSNKKSLPTSSLISALLGKAPSSTNSEIGTELEKYNFKSKKCYDSFSSSDIKHRGKTSDTKADNVLV